MAVTGLIDYGERGLVAMDGTTVSSSAVKSGIGKRRSAAKKGAKSVYRKRRKEIAEAATRVFHQRGFQATSMSAVAAELGIDRASLYYYISSKEELFDEVVREVVQSNVAVAKKIRESDMTPPEKLRELIAAMMASYVEDYPLIYIYIRENLRMVEGKRSKWSRKMRALNHDYEDAVVGIIDEGYADGSFRNLGPSNIVAYGVIGMVSWTNRWFRPDRSETNGVEIGRIYTDIILSGLQTTA